MEIRLDIETALDNLGGDESLLCSLGEIFLEEVPEIETKLPVALVQEDRKVLRQLVHRVIGLTSNFGAEPVTEIAKEIEFYLRGESPIPLLSAKVQSLLDALRLCTEAIEKMVCMASNAKSKSSTLG